MPLPGQVALHAGTSNAVKIKKARPWAACRTTALSVSKGMRDSPGNRSSQWVHQWLVAVDAAPSWADR